MTLPFAAASWYMVERPCLGLKDVLGGGKQAEGRTAATVVLGVIPRARALHSGSAEGCCRRLSIDTNGTGDGAVSP